MMFPQQERALLPGDPGAFKRRRLSSLSDGNAVAALLSFKDQKEGGQSFSSTSACCSSVTNSPCGKQGDLNNNEILGDGASNKSMPPPVLASTTSPPLSFLHMAMAQPPSLLPIVETVRDLYSLSECSMSLPAGRPLPPPPRLPTSLCHKQRYHYTK